MAYYSLTKIARAAFVCMAYFIANPLLLMLLIKYVLMVSEIEFLWIFGISGSSVTIFVITTALNVVPIEWLKWVFLGVSGGVSLMFIIYEMFVLLRSRLKQGIFKFVLICLFLSFSHAIFVLALKKYFLT